MHPRYSRPRHLRQKRRRWRGKHFDEQIWQKNPIVSFCSTVEGEIGPEGTLFQPVRIGCTTAVPHVVQCAYLMWRS